MEKGLIHLDSHSTTSLCSASIHRMEAYLKGVQMRSEDWELCYQAIYELLGVSLEDTFILTSSAAEAVNQVFWSVFLEIARKKGKCHFIASSLEDAPTMQMLKRLEDLGCFVKLAPVNAQGQIDLEALKQLITARTALVSVTVAHGLTGVVQPVEEIASIAKEKEVLLHFDAAYAVGKYDLSHLRPDYLTFSGERLHAAPGTGGLFVKKGAPLSSLIVGGSEQAGFRGGDLNSLSFLALSAAASQISLNFDAMTFEMSRLRNLLESEIQARIPDAKVLFSEMLRLPNTTAILFPGSHHEALLYLLERKGVMATAGGTYCQHLHRILASSGINGERALSFSLDRMTTQEDIVRAASVIGREVRTLRTLSEAL